jgi:signal recognition particle subunit SEC65
MTTEKKPRPSRADRKAAKQAKALETQAGKAEIEARVAREKANPSAPKQRKTPGTIRAARAAAGITLTAIIKNINERIADVIVYLDADGNPTGLTETKMIKPSRATILKRREHWVKRGLLGALPTDAQRRKVRRRNNRNAACNTKNPKQKVA